MSRHSVLFVTVHPAVNPVYYDRRAAVHPALSPAHLDSRPTVHHAVSPVHSDCSQAVHHEVSLIHFGSRPAVQPAGNQFILTAVPLYTLQAVQFISYSNVTFSAEGPSLFADCFTRVHSVVGFVFSDYRA